MSNKALLRIGVFGTIFAAICCFTPLLVWLLAIMGLSYFVGVLDVVLRPALGFFILILIYALWKRGQSA